MSKACERKRCDSKKRIKIRFLRIRREKSKASKVSPKITMLENMGD